MFDVTSTVSAVTVFSGSPGTHVRSTVKNNLSKLDKLGKIQK
jgi:hypothetical protein